MSNIVKNESKNIIKQLNNKNISIEELSNKLNIDKCKLVAYLKGDIRFNLKHLNNIANYLEVSLKDIVEEQSFEIDIEKYIFNNNFSKSDYELWLEQRSKQLCERKVYLDNLVDSV